VNDIDDSKMPLLDHLVELRTRLLWSFVSLAVTFCVGLYFAKPIFDFLAQPMIDAGGKSLSGFKMFEAFFSQLKVAFFAAVMMSFPVFATQVYKFVAPGLYKHEKRALLPFLLMTPVLFTLGAALAYYFAIPTAIKFLLNMNFLDDANGLKLDALPGIGDYLDFVTKFIFGFGVSFLLPVVLMLLERAGIVTRDQLIKGRRYAVVGAFAIAAVLTPPDVLSQFLLAVPLCILYELSIFAIWFTQRRRDKDKAKDIVEG
jgi:sec-independent protein translocase protein TatC